MIAFVTINRIAITRHASGDLRDCWHYLSNAGNNSNNSNASNTSNSRNSINNDSNNSNSINNNSNLGRPP